MKNKTKIFAGICAISAMTIPATAFAEGEKQYGLQLGSMPTVEQAEALWFASQDKADGALDDKQLYIEKAEVNGKTFYRVMATGFNGYKPTNQLCEQLKSQNIDCLARKFTMTAETQVAQTRPETPQPIPTETDMRSHYALQLASERSFDSAQERWKKRVKSSNGLLDDKQLYIEEVDLQNKGRFYRVMALGFDSYSETKSLCTALEQEGGKCLPRKITLPDSALAAGTGTEMQQTETTVVQAVAETTELANATELEPQYGLQLGAVRSPDEADNSWQAINNLVGTHLVGKRLHIQEIDLQNKGKFYRLIAVPFESKNDSIKLCNTLKDEGFDCLTRKVYLPKPMLADGLTDENKQVADATETDTTGADTDVKTDATGDAEIVVNNESAENKVAKADPEKMEKLGLEPTVQKVEAPVVPKPRPLPKPLPKLKEVTLLPSRIDMSLKPGNVRNIGEVNLFSPVVQSENNVQFLTLIAKGDNKSSSELNIGYGVRDIYEHKFNPYIIGMYGYIDIRKTSNNNMFKQVTLGAEYLSDLIDLRGNVYEPFGDMYSAIQQKPKFNPSTSSIVHANKEYAMGGWDAEIGTQYKFDENNSFHVFAGRFHFDHAKTKAIKGNRYRAEMRFYDLGKNFPPNSRFTVGYETQKDDVRNKGKRIDYGMLRLSIPLYSPADDREQLKGIRRRLIDPVIRDVDIVAGTNEQTETAYMTNSKGKLTNDKYEKPDEVGREKTNEERSKRLYELTTDKKGKKLILVTDDIETWKDIKLQENQKLIAAGKPVTMKTKSGITIKYVPELTEKPKKLNPSITNKILNKNPITLGEGSEVSDKITVKKTVWKSDNSGLTTQAVDMLTGHDRQVVTLKRQAGKSSSAFKPMQQNGNAKGYTYSIKCYKNHGEELVSNCENGANPKVEFDPKTGEVKLRHGTGQIKVKITATKTTADGTKKVAVKATLFDETTYKTAQERAKSDLKHQDAPRNGVKLKYNNRLLCKKDLSTHDGNTCNEVGSTGSNANHSVSKLRELEKIIAALTDVKSSGKITSEKLKAALEKYKATLAIFDKGSTGGGVDDSYKTDIGNDDGKAAASLKDTKTMNSGYVSSDTKARKGRRDYSSGSDNSVGSLAVRKLAELIWEKGISKLDPDKVKELQDALVDAIKNNNLNYDKATGKIGSKSGRMRADEEQMLAKYFAEGLEAYFNVRGEGYGVLKGKDVCGYSKEAKKEYTASTKGSVSGNGQCYVSGESNNSNKRILKKSANDHTQNVQATDETDTNNQFGDGTSASGSQKKFDSGTGHDDNVYKHDGTGYIRKDWDGTSTDPAHKYTTRPDLHGKKVFQTEEAKSREMLRQNHNKLYKFIDSLFGRQNIY